MSEVSDTSSRELVDPARSDPGDQAYDVRRLGRRPRLTQHDADRDNGVVPHDAPQPIDEIRDAIWSSKLSCGWTTTWARHWGYRVHIVSGSPSVGYLDRPEVS